MGRTRAQASSKEKEIASPKNTKSNVGPSKGKGASTSKKLVLIASPSRAKGKAPKSSQASNKKTPKKKKKEPTYQEYLCAFKKTLMEPTKYADKELLAQLGLLEDVQAIFENMGLGKFFNMEAITHPLATTQFLSSVTMKINNATSSRALGHIEFKVQGSTYVVQFDELCDIFGFPKGLNTRFYGSRALNRTWSIIASGDFRRGISKSNKIRNPTIRIAHRILANTLFPRKDTSFILPPLHVPLHNTVERYFYNAHHLQQKWNALQEKTINKLKKTVKVLKKQVKGLKSKLAKVAPPSPTDDYEEEVASDDGTDEEEELSEDSDASADEPPASPPHQPSQEACSRKRKAEKTPSHSSTETDIVSLSD